MAIRYDLRHRLFAIVTAVATSMWFAMSVATAQTLAAPTLATKAAARTQILLLGTAGGPPLRAHRAEPSTMLIVDGHLYLFDCGLGAVRQILAADLRPEAVHTVFITHQHPDHTLDLVGLMGNAAFTADALPDPQPLRIYGPPGTVAMSEAAIAYLGVPFGQFAAERLRAPWPPKDVFDVHDVAQDGLVFSDDRIRVYASENSHFSQMSPQDRRGRLAFSYRVETPDAVIVITGDTGPSAAVTKLAKGADVLITEAIDIVSMETLLQRVAASRPAGRRPTAAAMQNLMGHMRFEHLDLPEVRNLAKDAQVRSVIVTHIGPESDATPEKGSFASRIQPGLSIPVLQGRDLAHYCVTPKGAGGAPVAECATEAKRP